MPSRQILEGRRAIYNYARAALVEQLDKRPFIKKRC
jgi:hypothetical protein